MKTIHEIPIAHTPLGGYGQRCRRRYSPAVGNQSLRGARLRGTWRVVDVRANGERPSPTASPVWKHIERIEQAGDRVVVTAGGVIHDMRADGTYENGVNDVAGADFQRRSSLQRRSRMASSS